MTTQDIAGLVERAVANLREWADKDGIAERKIHMCQAISALESLATQVEALETDASLLPAALQRIEALAGENARLREAYLRHIQIDNGCIGNHGGWLRTMRPSDTPPCDGGKWETVKCGCAQQARAALGDTPAGLDRQGPRDSAG